MNQPRATYESHGNSGAFAFSADPITLGHERLIESAKRASGDLRVLVSTSAAKEKSRTFAIPEAIQMVRESIGHIVPPENVYTVQGSLARHFRREGVDMLYRWTRNVVDEAYEASLEFFYKSEHPELQIVRLRASSDVGEVSSSAVKESIALGHGIEKFVRPSVKASLESRLLGQYPVALTGPTGAGKSHFSRKMAEIGKHHGIEVHHIDYDRIAHEIYSPTATPEPIYVKTRAKIAKAFPGSQAADGSIDRAALRKYVFDSPDAKTHLQTLDSIMRDTMLFRYRDSIAEKKGILLVDAALLAEHGMTSITNHRSVLVDADDELRAERIAERAAKVGQILSAEQIETQMRSQDDAETKRTKLLSIVERERFGFVQDFDSTAPTETEYENAFWWLVREIDTFGDIRASHALRSAGVAADAAEKLALSLRHAHNTRDRHYHSWKHVTKLLDYAYDPRFEMNEEDRMALRIAILFHDSIYSTDAAEYGQNEIRSVMLLEKSAKESGIPEHLVRKAAALILDQDRSELGKFFHDIDYAILGSDTHEYATYREDVRREWHGRVSPTEYLEGRKKFLQNVAQADVRGKRALFRTEHFQRTLGEIARQNALGELETLGYIR